MRIQKLDHETHRRSCKYIFSFAVHLLVLGDTWHLVGLSVNIESRDLPSEDEHAVNQKGFDITMLLRRIKRRLQTAAEANRARYKVATQIERF